jgi:hypothetical protein
MLARSVTYDDCASGQQTQIGAAHARAKVMMQTAIDKLRAYDGTNPPEVKRSLQRNFHSESTTVAWIVSNHLKKVIKEVDDTQYECHTDANGSAEAEALWCIPWSDIKVYPLWYANSRGVTTTLDYRASTLAHEWMHRYDCRLDVGYEWEGDYSSHGTLRQLMNADSFGTFVYEVRDPAPASP